eukprot:TRINITY_DN349_c0_g2_i1.p1 TRINITY_DN349_c0_g2~~TRINITY_DN349_c0_g2_i1.p1  ORF type:complete len:157 (-),score=24.27 TRINITY_DN349_c0_g2_i1:75-545(-)
MGFVSFAGRVLFSSIFILAAWQQINEFDNDGGPSAKLMEPKIATFKNHFHALTGMKIPEIEMMYLWAAAIFLEGFGGILFIFGSTLGAYMLLIFLATVTPLKHDFYNIDMTKPEYVEEFVLFLKDMALFGALLFFLGMKSSFTKKPKKKLVKSKIN